MKPTHLFVHTSDSPFGNARLVDTWHKQRGFKEIGYNGVILNGFLENSRDYVEYWDGMIESGRPFGSSLAHATGYNNNSLAVCLIGKNGVYTEKQYNALRYFMNWCLGNVNDKLIILGHGDVDSKKPFCPGFNVKEWVKTNII